MSQIKIGDFVFYKGRKRGTVVRASYPRWGDKRVVFEREGDKQRFTVAVKYLSPVARLETRQEEK